MTTETLLRPRTERLRRIVGAALAVTLTVALLGYYSWSLNGR